MKDAEENKQNNSDRLMVCFYYIPFVEQHKYVYLLFINIRYSIIAFFMLYYAFISFNKQNYFV